jgi:hypothetical protein
MGQIFHGSATTAEAVRRAIQNSQASLRELAARHGINPKTVAKWRRRSSVCDARMGPREPRSTVLSKQEEALIVAFRKHTLLPLDDWLYALQPTVPHLTRSSLHRCFRRHGIRRLPETQGDKPAKKKFKSYPIGYFHIDIAEVRTEEGNVVLPLRTDVQGSLPRSVQMVPVRRATTSSKGNELILSRNLRLIRTNTLRTGTRLHADMITGVRRELHSIGKTAVDPAYDGFARSPEGEPDSGHALTDRAFLADRPLPCRRRGACVAVDIACRGHASACCAYRRQKCH